MKKKTANGNSEEKTFSINRIHRMIRGAVCGIGSKQRASAESLIEKILSEEGIPQTGINWRREHIGEIDSALESLRWWLDDCRHHKFETDYSFKDAAENPVRCPICGRMDNGWPIRHGLCCSCWCREYNFRYGALGEKTK